MSRFTSGILTSQKGVSPNAIQLFYNTLDPFFAESRTTVSSQALRERYGILPGEKVIISDMSRWDGVDRVRVE